MKLWQRLLGYLVAVVALPLFVGALALYGTPQSPQDSESEDAFYISVFAGFGTFCVVLVMIVVIEIRLAGKRRRDREESGPS